MSVFSKNSFVSCISLGYNCVTAATMGLNGLRSFSGPFDWCISELPSVLEVMENNFEDFMDREILISSKENQKHFTYSKYCLTYPHDIRTSLANDYEEIKEKYQRRIRKFRNAIEKPTCFFRIVKDNVETSWINENMDYIESIIKRMNRKNEIIFLIGPDIELPKCGSSFHVNLDESMFDSPPKLHNFISCIFPRDIVDKNLRFYIHNAPYHFINAACFRPALKDVLVSFFSGRDWYIWGGAAYGSRLKKRLDGTGVRVLGFIDNSPDKIGSDFEGLKVYHWNQISSSVSNVFIAISDPKSSTCVKEQIHTSAPRVSVYEFRDLAEAIQKLPLDAFFDSGLIKQE